MHLLINRWTKKPQILQVHRSHGVEGTGHHYLRTGPQSEGQRMYYLLNISLPKPVDKASINFVEA